jgi:hypothetical protein
MIFTVQFEEKKCTPINRKEMSPFQQFINVFLAAQAERIKNFKGFLEPGFNR